MKRVLITGITGYIGSHLAHALLPDCDVYGLVREPLHRSYIADFQEQLHLITADGSYASVEAAVRKAQPDLVYHLAAYYTGAHGPEATPALIASNVTFGAYLLEAMSACGCSALIYASVVAADDGSKQKLTLPAVKAGRVPKIIQAIQLNARIGYNMGIKRKEMLPMQESKVNTLTGKMIREYAGSLRAQERAEATIEKYLRDVRAFVCWLKDEPVAKETAAQWKEHLLAEQLSPATVNAKLSAVNGLFRFLGWEECRVKFLKVQRKAFRDSARELKKEDYTRLVAAARRQGREWLDLAMETMCGAGLRVSEIKCITVEAARAGRVDVALKGKIRTILLPGKLARKLEKYARKQKIASGVIFRAGDGMPLNRFQIWRAMKTLCREAGVEPSKVFPHNLRHLFATAFYQATKDIVKLADVLGHSSINTTRIYLMTTGEEHAQCLEGLGLVS